MKIVIINGQPRAGKDQFVTFCKKHYNWCLNLSTVDFVKEIAAMCGWDGTKTPNNRKFLSDLKDLLTNWNDVPYQKIKREIELFKREMKNYNFDPDEEGIIFIHCREPKEISRFVEEMGAYSLLIRRPEEETEEQSNHSDSQVFDFDYEFIIHNDGTLEELEGKTVTFLQVIGLKNLKY